MKAILEDMKTGEVMTCDVPPPELQPGGILVRTHYSAISAGTELAKVRTAEKSLLGKALARPDLARQVIDYARTAGPGAAYHKVRAKLETLVPLGYSCSGVVLAVGDGVTEFQPGNRVACGGVGAGHCELNFVPRNLAVQVPDVVPLSSAALTTIGAIAMQGLRQSGAVLGETVAVVGAGLVGVLACQLARASGCRVIALDRDPERAAHAVVLGAHLGLDIADPALVPRVLSFSRYGADVVLLAAATTSSGPLELATQIARDRARIVVVGDVGLSVARTNMYSKELSVLMSRSYGPGRYDAQYEEGGVDYPIGYVRWTERRNMEAFLDLLASGALNVEPLLDHRYPVEEGAKAYQQLRSHSSYTCLVQYPAASDQPVTDMPVAPPVSRPVALRQLRIGCIGAGSFARSVIFPALRSDRAVVLESVATASGTGAEAARRSFRFTRSQAPGELIANPDVDVVLVLSRHASHATYVVEALQQHKPVFVEKPLAVDRRQLASVTQAYAAESQGGRQPFLMVGFNRRFAPATREIVSFFSQRREPMLLHARINATYLPRDHWTQQDSEGSRIIGEFCHFVDWARAVVGVPIVQVAASVLPNGARYCNDNVAVTLAFADGSIANLLYLANGDRAVPKEYYEVFSEGAVARLDDFHKLLLTRSGKTRKGRADGDKGHQPELAATLAALASGAPAPIPFSEIAEVTEGTFAVVESLSLGAPVMLRRQAPVEP